MVTLAPMAEIDRILATASEWGDRHLDFALATVIGVRGSTYRGLGARQLVAADGTGIGTVSGGCLDADLRVIADQVIESGVARRVEFDLTADDEAIWGWGIGCNGATELLVEPASTVLDLVRALQTAERPVAVVHRLGPLIGTRSLIGPADPELPPAVQDALSEGWSRLAEIDGEEAMIEVVGSARRLVVCGAGHDAAPLVQLAGQLGYEPVVVDDRRPFLTHERFPGASQLVHVSPAELGSAVELDETAFVVIMSHNYLRDLDYLAAVLGTGVPYIGVLGPGERLARLLKDLADRGHYPDDDDRAALFGPAGLDIGAEGPLEIAWAILSEITAVRRRAPAGFLRTRKGPEL